MFCICLRTHVFRGLLGEAFLVLIDEYHSDVIILSPVSSFANKPRINSLEL